MNLESRQKKKQKASHIHFSDGQIWIDSSMRQWPQNVSMVMPDAEVSTCFNIRPRPFDVRS